MRYPDYVKQFRPKGTVVKHINGKYYAYYATSKRVPGKNYPVQIVKGLAGTIDQFGFHDAIVRINKEQLRIRECGFTNFLLKFEDRYVYDLRRKMDKYDAHCLYRSMIVYLSNNSYLNEDKEYKIYSTEELVKKFKIGVPNQVTAITKLCEIPLKELEPLKQILCIPTETQILESTLTDEQRRVLERMGLDEKDVRNP